MMTYVVTTLCIGCKDTACAKVCPVESFHEGPEQLYINPDCCVICDACVAACPVDAIFHIDDVPAEHSADIKLNAEMCEVYPVFEE